MNISEKLDKKIKHISQHAQIFEHVDNGVGLLLLTNRDRDAFICGALLLKPLLLEMNETLEFYASMRHPVYQSRAQQSLNKFEEFLSK